MKLEELSARIAKAKEAGTRAAAAVTDGGTCCLDYVFLPRKLARPKVAAAPGLHDTTYFRSRGWSFSGRVGQAQKVTVYCLAAAKELEDLGARIVYVTD